MGLESGWNCHISLKSNDGLTSMRKTVSYHCPSRPGYLPGRKKSGKRAAVAARNIKLIGMYIIIKKRVGTVDSGNSKRLNSKQSLISKHFW